MSEIQDLLNASTQDMVDDYLIIDDNSREIYVPLGELLFGVTNDEKTERKYFQCPRIVGDNVDLTQYQLYINYQNANGEKDKYIVTDVKVVDDNITFTWLLSRKVTEYQGNISFIVCARNVDSLGNITNEWNTTIATGTCVVGLEVDDLTPGEQEQARDYFLQLEQELSALAETENNRLLTTSSNQITNITNKGSEQVQLVENTAKKALDSIPSTYTDLQKQVNEVEDRELKDANGITQELTITDGYAQLTDTATKRLDSLVIKGNTVQNSTKGLNLINCTPKTTNINGITMVNNGDGTYTVNGTATNDFDIALAPYTTKQNIYYTLSGCPSGGSKTTYYLDPRGYDYDTGRGITIRNQEQDFSNYIRIVIKKDVTVNNLLFKPMFNEGQTAQPFEPYTGGKPSPSPEYPQEIKAVSKLSGAFYSKNLFDFNIIKDSNITRGTAVWTNNSVTITSNASDCYTESYGKKNYIKVKPNTTYTLLFKRDKSVQGSIYIFEKKNYDDSNYYDVRSNTSSDLKKAWTFTTKSSTNYLAFRLGIYQSGQTCTFSEIMLVEGSHTWDNISYENGKQSLLNYTLQNPLYKLGDIYDYIDLNRGKIVYKIKKVIISTATFNDFEKNNKRCLFYNEVKDRKSYIYDGNPLVLSNIAKSMGNIGKFLQNSNGLWQTTSLVNVYWYPNVYQLGITDEDTLEEANVKLQSFLTNTPLILYYELATPTEEDIPTELLTQLKQLQTYSGETNISFEASDVYPTIDLEYIKDTKKYIESKTDLNAFVENMFALQRTGKVYTVKFPLWETSHVSTGEKLDANAGLVCEPSTKTIKGQNDYENIPLFKTYDVNAYVDDEGVRHITAIKGQNNFKDTGKNDVFVLGMSYYEKVWSDNQYWYYSRTDSPREGYTIARECINRDGSIQPFALYSKYVCGDIDGILYSSKGLMPSRQTSSTAQLGTLNADNSYNGMISAFQKRGKFYSGGMTCDYKYILTTFYLKYATLNSQSIMAGCTNYSFQYVASIQSEGKSTYFPLTKTQANVIEVGSYVSVGYTHINKSTDRYHQNMHMYANDVKVLRKEALDDSNVAIYLDVKEPFNTMPVTVADGVISDIYISSMHWRSGFSDDVLDRDGCPCETKSELTNGKFPIVIQGIECMVGGYETYGNAFMDIVDATGKREVYIQNDASLLTTNMTTAKSTYKKSPYSIQPQKLNTWNYITRIDFDLENGAFVQSNCGQDGSSTTTGFADGLYVDNVSSGKREFLGLGGFSLGRESGLSCLDAHYGVGTTSWSVLARLSINGVGSELTTK